MKIGLYGGMANNMYVFAKAVASQGVEACFIRDRSDRYPMSQPVWEDVPFSMGYDEVPRAAYWDWEKWKEKEQELNWVAPEWLVDPATGSGTQLKPTLTRTGGIIDTPFASRYLRVSYRASALRYMQACDALIVCGVEGSILANASGRPYIIVPFGGDLMIAAGLLQPKFYRMWTKLIHTMTRRQLVRAYANAVCIGVHEPTGFATDFYGAEHFFRKHKSCFVAIPIPVRQRAPAGDRRQTLRALLAGLGFESSSSAYVGFVPSRIDYEWKGHDRLLNALARLDRQGKASDLHLIFSGWGNDFDAARCFVEANDLCKRTTFLDCALSKPLLYQFYLNADFVVDQFIVGMLGTAALEAMSCGAPLITWINDAAERAWGTPPVLQARTTNEIAAVLERLSSGHIDLDQVGTSLQEWLGRLHNPATVVPNMLEIFNGA
jgi:glycosyltransferase involved in cell wall biosynthesis